MTFNGSDAQNISEAYSKNMSTFGSDVNPSNISNNGIPENCFEKCNVINTMEGNTIQQYAR